MKNLLMVAALCATILFTGCSNNNQNVELAKELTQKKEHWLFKPMLGKDPSVEKCLVMQQALYSQNYANQVNALSLALRGELVETYTRSLKRNVTSNGNTIKTRSYYSESTKGLTGFLSSYYVSDVEIIGSTIAVRGCANADNTALNALDKEAVDSIKEFIKNDN